MTTDAAICRWDSLSATEQQALLPQIDHIFFSSSTRQTFADDGERAAFRERWLGRYLTHYPQLTWIARAPDGRVAGYVVGSTSDPARDPMFSDLPFLNSFATLTERYPAHLHVNLAGEWRGRGIGSGLVQTFADAARASGSRGVHVVTGAGMRNVGFYLANNFKEVASVTLDGRTLLLLGRDLT